MFQLSVPPPHASAASSKDMRAVATHAQGQGNPPRLKKRCSALPLPWISGPEDPSRAGLCFGVNTNRFCDCRPRGNRQSLSKDGHSLEGMGKSPPTNMLDTGHDDPDTCSKIRDSRETQKPDHNVSIIQQSHFLMI